MKITYTDNNKIFNLHEDTLRGIPFLSFEMLDKIGVPNMCTTRYKSYDQETKTGEKGLRVAYMKGEELLEARSVISENLELLAEQLATDRFHLGISNQQHTVNVRKLDENDLGYWKNVNREEPIDALISNVHNACLVIYGADCPSVYLVDPVHKAIGLAHSGWKGTLGKIAGATLTRMTKEYGTSPSDVYAAIGPSISEAHYEMGDEIFELFSKEWGEEDAKELMKRHESGKYHLDLWKAIKMTLLRAGVAEDHIAVTNICTYSNTDTFYSYRAGKMENEQAAMLVNRYDTKKEKKHSDEPEHPKFNYDLI